MGDCSEPTPRFGEGVREREHGSHDDPGEASEPRIVPERQACGSEGQSRKRESRCERKVSQLVQVELDEASP